MLRAFSTAATGMSAQQMIVDTIANNLANINTVGFKRSQIDFQDLMYVKQQEAGREIAAGLVAPNGFEIGSGVRPASTLKVFTQGEMENTGRNLDIAVEGDGFLQVTMPGGGVRYTRDGSLRVNADGNLVTSSGYLLEPAITIPANTRTISIGADGTVSVFSGTNTAATTIGTITLARFANSSGLSSEGRNLLAETPASGAPVTGTAGQQGLGTIQQGFLERSNVQMVTELVNLITAQRAYEINSRAIKAGDDMLTTATQMVQ
jgi:flagellar basal-body rod protein FlgG